MKNLYKIEDELYIISDNENINENDYIITKDSRLVQVSYLLSKDLEGASKVIFTTNALLVKDGVQAIDDEFLEWFVKNPSCEKVEVISERRNWKEINWITIYKIIIPKEVDMLELGQIIPKEESTKCYCGHTTYCDCGPKEESKFVTVNIESATGEDLGKVSYIPLLNLEYVPKQETLEEVAIRKRKELGLKGTIDGFIAGFKTCEEQTKLTLDDAYSEGFENGKQEQNKNLYSEEDLKKYGEFCVAKFNGFESVSLNDNVFEQFKKK